MSLRRLPFYGACLLLLLCGSAAADGDPFAAPGELQVILQPAPAITAGAAWRLPGETEYHPSSTRLSVPAGDYLLEYQPLDGFTSPPAAAVSVKSGAATNFTATYGIPTSGVPARIPDLRISSDGSVKAMARMDDGRVVIGGEFTSIDGVPRRNLARLASDGSVDLSWNPNPDGPVTHLFLAGDTVYVAGLFRAIGGLPRSVIAKVSLLGSGAADGQWNAKVSEFYSKHDDAGKLVRLRSNIMLLTGNAASVYIYGQYDRVGAVGGTVMKLDARTGAVDAAWVGRFNAAFPENRLTDSPTGVGPIFGVPNALLATADALFLSTETTGKIYKISTATGRQDPHWEPPLLTSPILAGGFLYGDDSFAVHRVSVTGDGAVDPNWDPTGSFDFVEPIDSFNGFIYAFNPFNGLNVKRIAIDTKAFDPGWVAPLPSYTDPDRVTFLATAQGVLASGVRVIPDDPHHVNGPTKTKTFGPLRFAVADGASDASFRVGVQANTVGLGQIVALPDGKFILLRGGRPLSVLGRPLGPLSRILPDGTLDPAWNPNLDGEVNAATVADNFLYITGSFTQAGGLHRNGVARLPLDGDGSADPLWYPSDVEGSSILTHVVHRGFIYLAFALDDMIVGAISRYPLAGAGALDVSWDGGLGDYDPEVDSFPREPVLIAEGDGIYLNGPFTYRLDALPPFRTGVVRMLVTGAGGVDRTFKSPVFPVTIFGGDLVALFGDALFYDGPVSPKSIGLEAGPKRGATRMATDGQSLFISLDLNHPGRSSQLAKLSLATGALIPAWKPVVDDTVEDLRVVGDKVYLGGSFRTVNGVARGGVARVSTTGAGALDKTWEFDTDGAVFALEPLGNDVVIAGSFNSVSGFPRLDLAVLPTLDAPLIQPIPNQPAAFTIQRSTLDGPFVTHFQFTGITGGAVRSLATGETVAQGDFVSAETAAAGFTFEPLPGASAQTVTAVAALGDGVGDGTAPATSYVLNLVARPAAFQFARAAYSVSEATGTVSVTVLKTGAGAASVAVATRDGSALSTGDYQPVSQRLEFAESENSKVIAVVIQNDSVFRGDRAFSVQLSAPSTGATVGEPSTATVSIVEDDAFGDTGSSLTQSDVIALPAAGGSLQVDLSPAAAHGQWRLAGELGWRDGGTVATGLTQGNYQVEFRPINGYLEPAAQTVPVLANAVASDSGVYQPFSDGAAGSLQVFLKPDGIAAPTMSPHAQWRLQGEAGWRESGATAADLPAGTYVVEFSDVPAYATPRALAVDIPSAITRVLTATYTVAGMLQGQGPVALSANAAASQKPYVFTGQLRSSVGFGSGAAVLEKVVLTAAHVLFDDLELANATQVLWLPQKMRGAYEPPPAEPRGWFVFQGYAAQRQLDNSPGVSSPASQSLDVAAMFFAAPASRGQFSGFLSSDASPQAWLETSRMKDLVGYPVEGIPAENSGLMHASGPRDMHFTAVGPGVFSTADGYGLPGESGAPLYARGDDGVYRPAGIYLGGTAQTLVRGIDRQVVDVINRANTAARGDGNNTGGGIVLVSTASASGDFAPAQVTCNLSPALAVSSGAAWRLVGESSWHASGATISLSASAGTATIECKPVSGFLTPAPLRFSAGAGARVVAAGRYDPPAEVPVLTGNLSTTAIVDEPFTYQIAATQSPSSFAADPLPPGLTLNAGTGVISGTPTVIDFTNVQIGATNHAGAAVTRMLSLSVLKRGQLTVNVMGPGEVTPGFRDTTTRGVGQDLTIVATPNKNAVFAGWTGDIPSAEARKSFRMPEVLTLTANFKPSPFLTANGAYYGFAQSAASAAAVQLSVSPTGVFSLSAKLRGKSYSAHGQFLADGTFQGSLKAPDGKLTLAQLTLDFTAANKRVSGQIAVGTELLTVRADRAVVFTASNPNPAAVYTIALPRDRSRSAETAYPQGDGYGTLRALASGALKFTGTLGDGSKASASSHLVPSGVWLLAFPGANSTSATVSGEVTLQTDGTLTGPLQWARPAGSTAPYAGGFSGQIALQGSVYRPPASSALALNLAGPVSFVLSGPGFGPLSKSATLGARNVFSFTPTGTEAAKLSINPATGALTGSVRDSANRLIPLSGVILQTQKIGYGQLSLSEGTGFLELNAP